MEDSQHYTQMRTATLIGAAVNFSLAVFKVIVGVVGQSAALLADGIHSFSDLLTDTLVLMGVKYGRQAADEEHPYGHGRIETAATLGVALLIAVAGLSIVYEAVHHLVKVQQYVAPNILVIVVAMVSVLANEGVYRYTLKVAQRTRSALLQANAWHSRGDAWSSIVVLVGVVGSRIGWHSLDQAAAIVVGVMIVHMSWRLSRDSLRELVDTGLDPAIVAQLTQEIAEQPGICSLHQLRTRSLAGKIFLDVHVLVDGWITVSEGHHLGEQVAIILRRAHPDIADVTVHVDPEDDESSAPSRDLPIRATLVPMLKQAYAGLAGADSIQNIVLHYLAGKITVELWLDKEMLLQSANIRQQIQTWQQQYEKALTQIDGVVKVRLLFS